MLDIKTVILVIIIVILALFLITSSAIGIESYNANKEYKQNNINKFYYLISAIVVSFCGIFGTICTLIAS